MSKITEKLKKKWHTFNNKKKTKQDIKLKESIRKLKKNLLDWRVLDLIKSNKLNSFFKNKTHPVHYFKTF
jgi:hypothetical protein